MIRQKRERLETIKDILYCIQTDPDIKSTNLMYKCNLSPQSCKFYINFLEDNGFIKVKIVFNKNSVGHKIFSLTARGRDYLIEYKKVEAFRERWGV